MSAWEWALAFVVIFLGSCAQASMGFGLGMIAAPFLAMIDRTLVPVPILILAMLLAAAVAWHERGSMDIAGVKWALAGRVVGTIAGTLVVINLSPRPMMLLFAALILIAVAISAFGHTVEPAPGSQLTAGAMSGFMGTITSVGGPPMALLYQRRTGAQVRSTLSMFFLFGTILSVTLLAVGGEIDSTDLRRTAVFLAPTLGGYLLSRRVAKYLDAGALRPILLTVSAIAATVVLLDALA